jgi:hypothetical protein
VTIHTAISCNLYKHHANNRKKIVNKITSQEHESAVAVDIHVVATMTIGLVSILEIKLTTPEST